VCEFFPRHFAGGHGPPVIDAELGCILDVLEAGEQDNEHEGQTHIHFFIAFQRTMAKP
jgi:hypothetical protein